MPAIIYVHPDGKRQIVESPSGISLMQAALSAGVDGIIAECGGSAMCATCHIYIEHDQLVWLPKMDAVEDEMLDSVVAPRESNSRLSCQIKVSPELNGLVVRLPERQQ